MPSSRPDLTRHTPLAAAAEDFLYHLYRGSELLSDGRYDGAREELDRALRAQPRDAAAQDLLAKVYFKLGVYPRAIELYQDIVRQFPDRVPPRINLALAFLKTGQMRDVVAQLLPVIEREPEHGRAWGYLGLAWSRLGEYAKAREAFTRAGHEGMARRMEEALETQYGPTARSAPQGEPNELLRPSMLPPSDLEPTVEGPGEVPVPPAPAAIGGLADRVASIEDAERPDSVDALAKGRSIAPRGEVLELDDGVLVAVGGCAARLASTCVEVGLERGAAVGRHGREGIFAGSPSLTWLRSGWVAMPNRPGRERMVLALDDETLSIREDRVLAFEGTLLFDNEIVAGFEVVKLQGRGRVVLETASFVRAVAVTAPHETIVPWTSLTAWTSGVMVREIDPAARVALRGDGVAFIALGSNADLGEPA